MRRWHHCRDILAALIWLATQVASHAERPGDIWAGASVGFAVQWSVSDIVVHRGNQIVFSASDWAKAGLAHFLMVNRASGGTAPPDCDYKRHMRIVSLVGTMMSLEDRVEIGCRKEAHPGGMTRLITVDLAATGPLAQAGRDAIGRTDTRHPGQAVLLTKLFPVPDILAALANTPQLREVLQRTGAKPKTVPDLLAAVAGASGQGDECFIVPDDLLGSFAFDRLDQDRIVLRLGLPGDGPCRMDLTTATVRFAMPDALAAAVRQAANGEAGFLADRGKAIAADRETEIVLHTGRGGEP